MRVPPNDTDKLLDSHVSPMVMSRSTMPSGSLRIDPDRIKTKRAPT